MGNHVRTAADVARSESFARQLRVIEVALESGDVAAAQQYLRAFRQRIAVGDFVDDPIDTVLPGGVALTGQEATTLRLLPDGSMSQKDIARAMGVSRNTLKTHLKSLYLKLGAHCRSEAIHLARDAGLLRKPFSVGEPAVDALVDVA